MRILITGGNGYIAKSLYESLKNEHDIIKVSRSDFDLVDRKLTEDFFKNRIFDVVIHCAVKGGNRLIKDDWSIIDDNLKMYYNLLDNAKSYHKLIYFGSGAELHAKHTPYGLSKFVIKQSLLNKENFYNLRIFAVFDENELDTRFIKSNIKRYINKQSIIVHEDKYMDFIYMKDLIKIVNYYIHNDKLNKEINCSYNTTYSLTKIADMINNLDDYKVDVEVGKNIGQNYISEGLDIMLDFLGLEIGIKEVYQKLKNAK